VSYAIARYGTESFHSPESSPGKSFHQRRSGCMMSSHRQPVSAGPIYSRRLVRARGAPLSTPCRNRRYHEIVADEWHGPPEFFHGAGGGRGRVWAMSAARRRGVSLGLHRDGGIRPGGSFFRTGPWEGEESAPVPKPLLSTAWKSQSLGRPVSVLLSCSLLSVARAVSEAGHPIYHACFAPLYEAPFLVEVPTKTRDHALGSYTAFGPMGTGSPPDQSP